MEEKYTLRVVAEEGGRELTGLRRATLSALLQENGFDAPTPCGGHGKCGKCRVRAAGDLSPAPDADGTCLACQTELTGEAVVWLKAPRMMESIEGLGELPDFERDPVDGEYGLAVDVGTTTVVAQLISLKDGRALAAVAAENPQRAVAYDVIGRTQAALEGRGGLLKELIGSEIARMEALLCKRQGISADRISARVCTGNTTMLYLLTGRSPESLAKAPFEADCLFDRTESGVYLPACFGAYVGADIVCALLASGMMGRDRTAMLIDIGTNGEIALLHRGRLYCCATAAGPAFEGVGISCGVSSVRGAIESARVENGKIAVRTIGDAEPVGVCGSGLIDVTACLLETEKLDETGAMDEDAQIAPGITLTRQDVRMIQLAKGSICAGMRTLMAMAGIGVDDVEHLYIAGGFGRHIRLESAQRIGLIPEFAPDRIRVIGNAALAGAVMYLLKRGAEKDARELVARSECINLAQSPLFQNFYVECMLFPEAE